MYDEHFEQVLKDHLRVSKDGRGGKYRVDKPLPTLIEYERMKQRAFTIPLGEILAPCTPVLVTVFRTSNRTLIQCQIVLGRVNEENA